MLSKQQLKEIRERDRKYKYIAHHWVSQQDRRALLNYIEELEALHDYSDEYNDEQEG